MVEELSDSQSLRCSTHAFPEESPPVEPAIVRSAPGVYVFRASTEEQAQSLMAQVTSGTPFRERGIAVLGELRNSVDNPTVTVVAKVAFGAVDRALAKTAMNFVCASLGPDVARLRVFDAVKAFALSPRYNEDDSPVRLVTQEEREQDAGLRDFASHMCQPDHHALVFKSLPEGLFVFAFLYQRPFAKIRLAESIAGFPDLEDRWVIGLFDYKRRLYRVYLDTDTPPPGGVWRV
jgi:hypothetical protein